MNDIVCFDKSYDLRRMSLVPPVSGGLEVHVQDKQCHGADEFACQGDATVRDGGLLLRGMGGAVWAAPKLWSGVKNVRVQVRACIEQIGDAPTFGVTFGRVWALDGAGPRVVVRPDLGRIRYDGAEGRGTVAEEPAAIPVGKPFTLEAEYAFDSRRVSAAVDGVAVLDMPLPHEPFEAFMARYGRPASLTGTGVLASDLTVAVEGLSIRAGAPRRRVAAIGDSNTQRHFWVQALERALGEPVTNLGIGGDCAALCRLRFDRDVAPLRPDIVVILAGTNDLGWQRPPEIIAGDVEAMVLSARAHGIRPLVGEILARRGWKDIPEANRALHAMCARQRVGMLEWYAATKDPATDEQRPGYAPDGCHPERPGGEAMVRAIDLKLFAPSPAP